VLKNGVKNKGLPLLNNLYLIGLMGAGKSTLGPLLARRWGCGFRDTDAMVEAHAKMTIDTLFKTHGEIYFRNLESEILKEICQESSLVVSLGGGSPLREQNWQKLVETGRIIYLRAKPETLSQRLVNASEIRPLLCGLRGDEVLAQLNILLAERRKIYENAHLIIDTDDRTVHQVAEVVLARLEETDYEKNKN
jgi:shikimate kinase